MSDRWSDRLSLYLDGDLDPREVSEIEAHLEGCAECASTLDLLREVSARARALEDRLPEEDLWVSIRDRIAAAPRRRILELPRFGLPRHLHFTWPQALAAGFAIMLVSGGTMWWLLRQGAPTSTAVHGVAGGQTALRTPGTATGAAPGQVAGVAPGSTESSPDTRGAAATASFAAAAGDPAYDRAIAELENTLAVHRSELDTSTVRIVEQNLAIIDQAIVQAQRALAADPASAYLHQHLALQRQLKLDLLRRTTALVVAQG